MDDEISCRLSETFFLSERANLPFEASVGLSANNNPTELHDAVEAAMEFITNKNKDVSASTERLAAEYVRMSTDHQRYSTENQSQAIREYAARNGLRIDATYADSGKSGLSLDGRDALRRLIDGHLISLRLADPNLRKVELCFRHASARC